MNPPPSPGIWNAGLYDSSHAFVWQYGASLVELLAPQPGERILDLGCGTGHLTAQIAATCGEVVGIDSSVEMIEQARHTYSGIRFELGDARTFSFGTGYDAVFSNAVLHWVQPPEQAIVRIRDTLRLGGRFVAEFGGKGNTRLLMAALLKQAAAFGITDYAIPWYYPGIAEYSALLAQNGFEVTFATLFDRPTPLQGDDGMKNWFRMFGGSLLDRLPAERRAACLDALDEMLRPVLHHSGQWHADYRRLRIVARRVD